MGSRVASETSVRTVATCCPCASMVRQPVSRSAVGFIYVIVPATSVVMRASPIEAKMTEACSVCWKGFSWAPWNALRSRIVTKDRAFSPVLRGLQWTSAGKSLPSRRRAKVLTAARFRGAGVGESPPPSASYTFWKAGAISRRDGSPSSSASVHPKSRSVSRFSATTLPRWSTTTMASGAASSICRNRLSCKGPSAPRASDPRNSLMTLPSCAKR